MSDAIETVEQTAPRAEHLPFLEAFLAGVEHEDPAAMREALDSARERFGMPEALQRVLLPGMRDVGWRWLSGRCDVGTEHLATDTARAWLTRFRSAPARAGGEGSWIVLACGPRDHHSVGLEAFAAILTEAGWRCHVLGGLTPEGALLRAGSKEGTRALVVVSHLATNRRATVAVLRSVAANIERPLFYAGNAFARTRARRAVPGTYLGEDLLEGAAIIQRAMRGERG